MILDFTITTCLRPEILRRTLESFKENLRGVDFNQCRVFVNIDPVGDGLASKSRVHLMGMFGDVIDNCPQVASFPAAVKWCFSQPTTTLAFHLEDDWELLEPIEIEQLFAVMDDEGRQVVNLRAHPFRAGIRRCFLSPGLWRSAFMHEVAAGMDGVTNPEINVWNLTDRYQVARYWPDRIVLRDIGREWLAASGFRKDVEVAKGVNPWTKWEQR